MGLLKTFFTNCACPQGRMGRAMLKFMNLCHAPLTNWGLKLVNIQIAFGLHELCTVKQKNMNDGRQD